MPLDNTDASAPRPLSNYPTIIEIPPIADGDGRSNDDMMRLILVPRDDVAFRAAVIEMFKHEETGNNRIGGPSKTEGGAHRRILGRVARTPGGVAWKVATALVSSRADLPAEDWSWWQQLLDDAIADLIDIERQRARIAPDDPVVELYKLWTDANHIVKACDEDNSPELSIASSPESSAHEARIEAAMAVRKFIEGQMIETVCTTPAGLLAKLEIAEKKIRDFKCDDTETEDDLVVSARSDIVQIFGQLVPRAESMGYPPVQDQAIIEAARSRGGAQ